MPGLVAAIVVAPTLALVLWAGTARSQSTVDVPGPNLPTIQSGIDALPNGGTVRLAVKTYKEHVVIDGKQIVLESAGAANDKLPTIKGDDPENAVITFLNGGGGTVRNLIVRGGAFGIAAPVETEQCATPASAVEVEGVQILKSGRGIYGSFASLSVLASDISKSREHGVALGTAGDVLIDGTPIHGSTGAGVVLYNYVAAPGALPPQVKNSDIFKNQGGGIDVRGHALPLTIDHCMVLNNKIFGVNLFAANGTKITNSSLSFTGAGSGTEKWGDGLRVYRSTSVIVDATTLSFNARAGASAFGCDGGLEATVDITNDTFNNPIDLDAGKLKICASPQSSSIFVDGGGNSCFSGGCAIRSSDITPVSAPAPL